MKILSKIIEESVDNSVELPVILRKTLVIATELKNRKLKKWTLNELNGYDNESALPKYRIISIQSKGVFDGGIKLYLDQPLLPGVLEEKHREWATTSYLRQSIASYEKLLESEEQSFHVEWPVSLVAIYQRKFSKGWILNRAWQDIPRGAIVTLVDTVRNRLLEFALDLKSKIGESDAPLENIESQRVDSAVTNIFYGGKNIIGSNIGGGVNQADELVIGQGDFDSLVQVLKFLGIPEGEIDVLKQSISEDKEAGESKGFGSKTGEWLGKALSYVGKEGGKVVGEVAKGTLTKALLGYFGLE